MYSLAQRHTQTDRRTDNIMMPVADHNAGIMMGQTPKVWQFYITIIQITGAYTKNVGNMTKDTKAMYAYAPLNIGEPGLNINYYFPSIARWNISQAKPIHNAHTTPITLPDALGGRRATE